MKHSEYKTFSCVYQYLSSKGKSDIVHLAYNVDIYLYACMLEYTHEKKKVNIYIYIYIPLRKPKTDHIRIINLFPSCYGYWYESITPKITGLLQI